ncbi:MAG TPA: hypothetical protein VK892_14640 [Pyrinomonadaceae bacterium]|nr:hypothetical protein [Pyrinomonadaceae bacterium]
MKIYKNPALCVLFLFLLSVPAFSQKMKAEDVLTNHLNSIGSKEDREKVKNQVIVSEVEVNQKGSATVVNGRAVIFSADQKSMWAMNLNSNSYPQDRFGFSGKDTKVAYSTPGVRSILGDFIYLYPELLKEGLLGGTLSTSWALLNADSKQPKLSYDGSKKINGVETHVLSYSPKSGSDLSIKMYFDKQNFQHIRTEYNRVVGARQAANIDASAGQGEDRYRIVEDFSDYKKAGDLTLPSTYKISYSYSSGASIRLQRNANREIEWKFNITNYSYNQEIDDNSFNIDTK